MNQVEVKYAVAALVTEMSGSIKKGQRIKMMATDSVSEVLELGFFKPKMTVSQELKQGEVGYLISKI